MRTRIGLVSAIAIAAVIVAVVLSCPYAYAQGGSVSRQVIAPTVAQSGTGQPASYALVQVCPSTATGFPCSPLVAHVYQDPALTEALPASFAADVNGNYNFFLPTGAYIVQETNAIGAGYTFQYSWLVYVNGTGTVSTVSLTMPSSLFSVSGSPCTTICTLAVALVSQNANTVFGNCTGSTAVPVFCALVANQIPSTLNATTINGLTVAGNETVSGTLGVTQGATFSSTLSAGASTLASLAVTAGATIGTTLAVTGTSSLNGGGTLVGTFTGNPTFSGTPVFGTANFTTGIEIGGTFGTSGYALTSTGSGTTFSPLYYQTVAANGSASAQKPTLNFSQRFTATAVVSPSETTVDANAPGSGNLVATYGSSPGASTLPAVFDGLGNVIPGTAVTNNYIFGASAGEMIQAGSTGGGGGTFSVSFSHTFSVTPVSCIATGVGGSVNVATCTTTGMTGNTAGVATVYWMALGVY